MEHKQTDEQYI